MHPFRHDQDRHLLLVAQAQGRVLDGLPDILPGEEMKEPGDLGRFGGFPTSGLVRHPACEPNLGGVVLVEVQQPVPDPIQPAPAVPGPRQQGGESGWDSEAERKKRLLEKRRLLDQIIERGGEEEDDEPDRGEDRASLIPPLFRLCLPVPLLQLVHHERLGFIENVDDFFFGGIAHFFPEIMLHSPRN